MAYRFLTIKRKVNAPLRRPISVQSYTGRAKRDPTTITGECICRSGASASDSIMVVSRDLCLKILSYSSIAIYLYFAARFSAARPFSEPSTTKGTLIFLGTRRTHHPTLQVTIVGPPGSRCSISRGETESLVVTSRRHLQDPTLHYAFPHICSCHQHVTAWTSTRLSWSDYLH